MASVTTASPVTNYIDQYESPHAPQNHQKYNHNRTSRSRDDCPASELSTTSAPSFKRGSVSTNDVAYVNTSSSIYRRSSRHGPEAESNKSMKDVSGEAKDPRRRGTAMEEPGDQGDDTLSYPSRRRSNQDNRSPRDGSVSGRRSRNASPTGDDRLSTVSSSRRRSSGSRNPERENRRPSKNIDPNGDEISGQRRPYRQQDVNNSDSLRQRRPSKPYDPDFKDPPGQIRPSRRYNSSSQHQDQPRHSSHYDLAYEATDHSHRTSRNDYNSHERAERVRSTRPPEPHQDPPGHIRRSSMHLDSDCSQGQRRAPSRERHDSEAPARRYSMSRSDSTGGDSHEGRRYQHRRSQGYGDREVDQTNPSGDTYRDVRRSQSRHSDVRRSSLSRSSSVEKSSDVEIEFRNRDRRAATARTRDRRNDEEANLQEQRRRPSRARAYGSQVSVAPDGVETNEYKQNNVVTHEGEHCRERVRSSHNDSHRQRRRSSSVANDDPDCESVDSQRQSTSASRGYRHHSKTRYPGDEVDTHTNEQQGMKQAKRRSGRSSKSDLEGETHINTTDSRYELDFSQDSSYSLVSQVSRQYNQPQVSCSTSRHEIRVEDDSCPVDRTQAPGHRRIPGRSSNRRRSLCSREDGEGSAPTAGAGSKPEGHHSRRSSSSKSNQDTGFASSPSTPRREDSQSRFSSDASPSRHGINDDGKHHRIENGRRRRRSNLVTNKSLDVPGVSLRKEQSLSSSGRGDSSFEEPVVEHYTEGRKKRHSSGARHEGGVDSSLPLKSVEDINRNIDTVSESNITAEIQALDNLASKEIAVSSSATSVSSTTLNKESCESAKALSSSTSTLKGATFTSKTSIAGSISSLWGRNNTDGMPAQSVGDRWRKLKQDMMPEKNSKSFADTGKEKAAAIFSAAAAKFMNSFPGVSAAFPNMPVPKTDIGRDGQIPQTGTESTDLHVKENGIVTQTLCSSEEHSADTTIKGSSVSPATSQTKLTVPSKSGDGNASLQTPTVASTSTHTKPGPTSFRVSTTSLSNVSTSGKTPAVSPAAARRTTPSSQRPSIVSTELSSHERRANVYAAMTERASDGSDSEDSGEMTPPPMDTDMKRKSKEVDMELTSFLPAEMSRREEKFHEAARVNDASAIRALLREKVGVNCRNSLDRTALHWAAANGNLEAVEALVEGGADLEAKDKYGMRAVLWSAWFGHIPVLRALVNAGASTRVTNKQGLGVLHCAAENNHVNIIAFIFDNLEPHDVNQIDKNERTPLHSAAEGGHVDAVNKLLECKADLHKKDKGGMTSVHLAAKHGNIDVLKALLLQGVEVDDRDVEGKSAVHLAAEAGHKDAVDLLLDYTANPNSETVKEITPLHLAAIEGHVEVCKSLVKYGCNVNAQNFQGNTALHLAANGNHKEVARVLVEAKCELDLPNTRLQTPLHVAVESGHLNVVQILLAGGASMETREKSGKSALQLAARGNYVAVVDMLIKAERYYANTRDYHDKDVGYVDPDTYLRKAQHPHAAPMKEILWKLATKQLKPTDWKKLAYHWTFTPEHVRAIEQEYTGTTSYREHSYRLLIIWLHGVRKDENVIKLLFEALVAIDRKHLAESVRRKVNMTMNTNIDPDKPCSPAVCAVS